ncbi:MAG: hypothetical protein ISEC1_P1825 [Thiomicrorhabdus sp.]|nr:MAG: hypothetical protein ISEC1_P1825 [Thiomicrorhabdus sp.]
MSQAYNFYKKNQINIFSLLLGSLFGFLMSRAGATTFDYHAALFLFEDLQLLKVFGTAVTVGVIGVLLLKKYQVSAVVTGQPINFITKPYKQGLAAGALIFGIGWGLTASCPGSVPIMIGEGKVGAYFTLIGLVLGTLVYGMIQSKYSKKH